MSNPDGKLVPGYRAVPMGYYERQIQTLKNKIRELEDKVDTLQERIDQYEWVIGVGDK